MCARVRSRFSPAPDLDLALDLTRIKLGPSLDRAPGACAMLGAVKMEGHEAQDWSASFYGDEVRHETESLDLDQSLGLDRGRDQSLGLDRGRDQSLGLDRGLDLSLIV
ncbi:hypothetical protein WMY93_033287 [Mugilogobius chulae]|uniref:Uncharacterized protein n=1 Tax=Mugilogobius chulae TaxID=88201 RepID=A0AAW0MU95_9GOBI